MRQGAHSSEFLATAAFQRSPRLYGVAMNAQQLADQAAELASKLKPGNWDAVQALALASIAQSLATIAQNQAQD